MWRVVFGGVRVEGVERGVRGSQLLDFYVLLMNSLLIASSTPFIMRSISVSESHSPKPNPKRHNILKMKQSTVVCSALSQSGWEIYWLGLSLTSHKDGLSNFQILPEKNLSPVFALAGWGRLLLFSSGECALDWFRIQRLVKGCAPCH